MRRRGGRLFAIAIAVLVGAGRAHADGDTIDRIYDPYVRQFEREVEYGVLHQHNDGGPSGLQWQKFAYGQGLSERWAGEVYAVSRPGGDAPDAIEVEAKRQLTEQGEYAIDWGLLMELERCFDCGKWEGSTGLLAERDWTRWSAIVNFALVYEWGRDINSEFESRLSALLRYRWSALFEPAVELYSGENTRALGPALAGTLRLGSGRGLRWNAALLFGLDGSTADTTAKLHIEYEFQ